VAAVFRIWSKSLKVRITASALLMLALVVWGAALVANHFMRGDLERVLAKQQFSTASFIATHIDRELSDHLFSLEMAASRITPAMLTDHEALQRYLDERFVLAVVFSGGLVVQDINGVGVADSPVVKGRRGTNYMNVDSVSTTLKTGRSSISRPIIGTRLKVPVLGIGAPIKNDDGQVIGVLSGVINLSKANFLEDIRDPSRGVQGGYRLVSPQSDMYVSSSDIKLVMQPLPKSGQDAMHDRYMQGFEGSGISVNADGVEELSSAKRISLTNWFVVVSLPTSEAFAQLDEMRRRIFLISFVLTLMAGAAMWLWLRRQLKPLEAATMQISSTLERKSDGKPIPVHNDDEIGALVSGFNTLLSSVETERDRAEQYLEIVGAFVVALDTNGRITLINRAGAQLLGYAPEVILGRNWFDEFLPEADRRNVKPVFETLMAGKMEPVEFFENRVLVSDGSLRLIYWHNRLIRDKSGHIVGTLSSGEDITERKKIEDSLIRSNAELEQFSHAVSHDLQEPLSMVSNHVHLLEERMGGKLDQGERELMAFAIDGTRRMSEMIRDLLEYSRIQRKGNPFVYADLKTTVQEAMENLKLSIEESGAEFDIAKLPVLMGDREQLLRLFQNLIDNAIKFRSPDAAPRIVIGAEKKESYWEFFIADNGIGIPSEELPRLFKIFQRLHDREKYPGVGIGLALCKRIVERHGGNIWAESHVGKGSVFRFRLPEKTETPILSS
jgi:PAS domain S-box-containing protein